MERGWDMSDFADSVFVCDCATDMEVMVRPSAHTLQSLTEEEVIQIVLASKSTLETKYAHIVVVRLFVDVGCNSQFMWFIMGALLPPSVAALTIGVSFVRTDTRFGHRW